MAEARTHDAPRKQAINWRTKKIGSSMDVRGKILTLGMQFASLLPIVEDINKSNGVSKCFGIKVHENENNTLAYNTWCTLRIQALD